MLHHLTFGRNIPLGKRNGEDDDTQNEVLISLEPDEFTDVVDSVAQRWTFDRTFPCEQDVATAVLNAELGEYTTKATIYTPSGDRICFS